MLTNLNQTHQNSKSTRIPASAVVVSRSLEGCILNRWLSGRKCTDLWGEASAMWPMTGLCLWPLQPAQMWLSLTPRACAISLYSYADWHGSHAKKGGCGNKEDADHWKSGLFSTTAHRTTCYSLHCDFKTACINICAWLLVCQYCSNLRLWCASTANLRTRICRQWKTVHWLNPANGILIQT